MALRGKFSSVSEAIEYFKPFRILGSHKTIKHDSDLFNWWVLWSNNPEENYVAHCSIEERIRRALFTFSKWDSGCRIVQFWAVERIAGNKCILTTSHQPFGIQGLKKGYCSYLKECMGRNIDVDPEADEGQLGPAGRAFRNRSIEYSPGIRCYTIQEFPLRDHAILCDLRSLTALPVFELDSNNIVGVLEFLSSYLQLDSHLDPVIASKLKEEGLGINYIGSSESKERQKYSEDVAKEIHNMFKEAAKTHPLALGLAFTPCVKEYCLNCSGIGCLDKPIAVYRDPHMGRLHGFYSESNGISGRAYASRKSCFCRDIRNFSILEYPLAYLARRAGLTFSFATCVQSIQYESSNVLVLEFLLLPGCYDIGHIKLFTKSLLTKMKEFLPSYNVAGEDFPGEELFPQNHDSLKYDEVDLVQGADNPLSLPVTLTCSGDRPNNPLSYILDHEKAVDFFLPVSLTYEARSSGDVLVLWRNDVETYDMDESIKHVFPRVSMEPSQVNLVQFWAPRGIAGKSSLTTYDQPFAIRRGIRKVTCLYRKECMSRKIRVDEEGNNEEQLGPVGRAFRSGFVEFSPDVRLYTIKEFPLRDLAVLWKIKSAIFLPVFQLDGMGAVGVLEILSDYGLELYLGTYLNDITKELKEVGLRIDYVHPEPGEWVEIEKIFEAVSVRYPLCFARALTPCLCDYCHNNSSPRYINRIWPRAVYHLYSLWNHSFHQLPNKNGVVAKALASRRSCFSMNIGYWGIKDYPISMYAELVGCNFSVAIPICVENTLLVDTPCVVEFFLLPGDYSNEYIRVLLDSLLVTVKEHLPPNFKILSKDVPGEPFFLEIGRKSENGSKAIISGVHGAAGGDTNPLVCQQNSSGIHVANYQDNISGIHVVDGTEAIQGEIIYEMHVAGGTEATPLVHHGENICEMHAADGIGETPPVHQEENIYEMHVVDSIETTPFPQAENICEMHVTDGIEASPPVHQGENNCTTQRSSSHKFHVTLDQLKLQFGNTLDEAAENLGVSRSTLKRIRKIHGIHRWPAHKKNKVNPSLFMKQNPNDAPHTVSSGADSTHHVLAMQTPIHSTHELQTVQHHSVSCRDSEADKIVTIKASYGDSTFIKFKLDCRATLQDLHEQVSKRLKWEASMFKIRYQDEAKDWVAINIDEDLKDCLQASIDRRESTVSMSINLRLD